MTNFNFNGMSDENTGVAVMRMMLKNGSGKQIANLLIEQTKLVIKAKGDIQKSIDIIRDAENNIVSAKHVEKTDLEICTIQLLAMVIELVRVVKSKPDQGLPELIKALLAERAVIDNLRKVENRHAEKLQRTIDLMSRERALLMAAQGVSQ